MTRELHREYKSRYLIIRDTLVAVRDNHDGDGMVGYKVSQVVGTEFKHGYNLLNELVEAGLLQSEKRGRATYYKITENGIIFAESLEKFHTTINGIAIRT